MRPITRQSLSGFQRLQQTAAVALAAFALLAVASATSAQSAPAHAKIELITDRTIPLSRDHLDYGLLFHLDPGWHIYWQNPGDSGEPPKVQWTLPRGFRAGAIEWPAPIRLGSGSVVDYGYENQVLLIVPITGPSAVARITTRDQIVADVNYIVCREICIPGKQHLSLLISAVGAAQAQQWHDLFVQARSSLPKPFPDEWKIVAESRGDNLQLTIGGQGFNYVKSATFFPEDPNVIDNSARQGAGAFGKPSLLLTLKKSDQLSKQPERLRGVLLMDGRAYQVDVPVRGTP